MAISDACRRSRPAALPSPRRGRAAPGAALAAALSHGGKGRAALLARSHHSAAAPRRGVSSPRRSNAEGPPTQGPDIPGALRSSLPVPAARLSSAGGPALAPRTPPCRSPFLSRSRSHPRRSHNRLLPAPKPSPPPGSLPSPGSRGRSSPAPPPHFLSGKGSTCAARSGRSPAPPAAPPRAHRARHSPAERGRGDGPGSARSASERSDGAVRAWITEGGLCPGPGCGTTPAGRGRRRERGRKRRSVRRFAPLGAVGAARGLGPGCGAVGALRTRPVAGRAAAARARLSSPPGYLSHQLL